MASNFIKCRQTRLGQNRSPDSSICHRTFDRTERGRQPWSNNQAWTIDKVQDDSKSPVLFSTPIFATRQRMLPALQTQRCHCLILNEFQLPSGRSSGIQAQAIITFCRNSKVLIPNLQLNVDVQAGPKKKHLEIEKFSLFFHPGKDTVDLRHLVLWCCFL